MGWHFTLEVECKVLPEFMDFFKRDYLRKISNSNDIYTHDYCEACMQYEGPDDNGGCRCYFKDEYKNLPKSYVDILNIWITYDLGHNFYEYEFNEETSILKFNNTAKVTSRRRGHLRDEYISILEDIIVPITSEIIYCLLSSDDYGDERTFFTDTQLRHIPFSLGNLVKCVSHKWEEGGIVQTTVYYKRSIKKSQQLDLDRCYGVDKI